MRGSTLNEFYLIVLAFSLLILVLTLALSDVIDQTSKRARIVVNVGAMALLVYAVLRLIIP